MKTLLRTSLTLLLPLLFLSCQPEKQSIHFQGEAQGTYYAITYYDAENRQLQGQIDSILQAFDQVASLWVENSEISRINRNEVEGPLSVMMLEMLEASAGVYATSGGAFDITVGPLVNAWGFGFRHQQMPDAEMVDSLVQFVGFEKLEWTAERLSKAVPEVEIDLNAIAQGFSVDVIGKYLKAKGISDFLVDVGGEVLASGKKPDGELWRVGIEKPAESASAERSLESIVAFTDKALATSGSYRKFYEKEGMKYSHTIDPRTGYPVQHSLLSASVLAENATLADAWATAFMVMGMEETIALLPSLPGLEVFLIYADETGAYQQWASEGMQALITEASN